MTTTKTPGQVAYEKFAGSEPFECPPWHLLKPAIMDSWEKIAQAVVQHHEEQREQAQRRSGRTTRMLLDAYYALMETQEPRPVVVVGGDPRQADTLFRIFSNRILGENPRWRKTDHKREFFDLSCPTRTIEFITYAELIVDTGNSFEWHVSNFRSGGGGANRLVFEDHAAKEIYDRRNNNMKPPVQSIPFACGLPTYSLRPNTAEEDILDAKPRGESKSTGGDTVPYWLTYAYTTYPTELLTLSTDKRILNEVDLETGESYNSENQRPGTPDQPAKEQ